MHRTRPLPLAHQTRPAWPLALCFAAIYCQLAAIVLYNGAAERWSWPLLAIILAATTLATAMIVVGLSRLLREDEVVLAMPVAPAPGPASRSIHRRRGDRGDEGEAAQSPDGVVPLGLSERQSTAVRDKLTATHTRHGFYDALARRADLPGQVVTVDCRRLRQVNDMLGYREGDRVLKAIAMRIAEEIQPGDVLARWGGDEFVIFFANIRRVEAEQRIATIQLGLVRKPVAMVDNVAVNISAGYAATPDASRAALAVAIREAHEELYTAKVGAIPARRFG